MKGRADVNMLKDFSFELPTRIEFGTGALKKLAGILDGLGARRVLFVTDTGIARSGILDRVTGRLDGGVSFEVFDNVEPNPRDFNVHEGAKHARRMNANVLVAVGGGSPIDCAKGMAIAAALGGEIGDCEGAGKVSGEVLPLVAVPTTAGTGSEVTFSAVITDTGQKRKFSIRSAKLAPRFALLDPALTVTLPPGLTASTGMDALTHAIEAYTATNANALSDASALHAIRLIAGNLAAAVAHGGDVEARSGMLLGSTLAGVAFSHSDVGSVHCLAEALGGIYDAPHGLCNAVILPAVMRYNMNHSKDRYAAIAAAMGESFASTDEGAEIAVRAVEALAREVSLPDFAGLGVREADFDTLAGTAAANGSNISNPRPMRKQDYVNLLEMLSRTR